MDLYLVALILLAGSSLGWFIARRTGNSRFNTSDSTAHRDDYFKGINFLLNEQPDQAIEVFIKLLEVDHQTVETHLALGNLYRRRGEVDRAIRIHQNLVARDKLSDVQRLEALLELAQDYLSAGLLDRAEDLFVELCEAGSYQVQALRQLIDIYEQEKDWDKAIRRARELEQATGNQLGPIIAHYYCEQAVVFRAGNDVSNALKVLGHALDAHRGCVRASLLEADVCAEAGDFERAVRALHRVEDQEPAFLPETIERAQRCYKALARPHDLNAFLTRLMQRYGGISATLELADIRSRECGPQQACDFLAERLSSRTSVRGLDRLLEYELACDRPQQQVYLPVLKQLTGELLRERPVYRCSHCGFPAKTIHWQCPSCKHWNTVKPIQGIEGE